MAVIAFPFRWMSISVQERMLTPRPRAVSDEKAVTEATKSAQQEITAGNRTIQQLEKQIANWETKYAKLREAYDRQVALRKSDNERYKDNLARVKG